MLRKLLDKDRVEADGMVVKFAPVDMGEAVREAVLRVRASDRAHLFAVDLDSQPGSLVFNRTVALRDTWAKIEKAKIEKEKPEKKTT